MDLYPLSDQVKEQVAQLRALIAEAIAKNDDDSKLLTAEENALQLQEDDLVRYIKARKFVIADAYQQLIETLRWRATAYGVGVDKMFPDGVDEREEWFQNNCPHCYRGHDKEGRPISWERTGVFQLPVLLEGVGEEGLLRRRIFHQELMARKMRAKTQELGHPVTQQVWVLDARNLSLKPSGDGPKLFRETTKMDSTYYPERLGYMLIVNAPWIFKPLWAMIKPWIDPNTVSKIRIFGYNDYQEELKKLIDVKDIPKEYGGEANWKVPGRPEDWSDVDDDNAENGYHPVTLQKKSTRQLTDKEKKKRQSKKDLNAETEK